MTKDEFYQAANLILATYQPSLQVKQQLSQVDLIATVGPTLVGKTTLMEASGLPYVPSDVTRPMRDGEVNGHVYNFREDYEVLLQELRSGEFVQFVLNFGEFYGTKASSYPKSGPATAAIIAKVIPAFRTYGFRKVVPVMIVPPSFAAWQERAVGEERNHFMDRLGEAKQSFEMALADSEYVYVVNDDLERAVNYFKAIANNRLDEAEQQRGRVVTQTILNDLNAVLANQ